MLYGLGSLMDPGLALEQLYFNPMMISGGFGGNALNSMSGLYGLGMGNMGMLDPYGMTAGSLIDPLGMMSGMSNPYGTVGSGGIGGITPFGMPSTQIPLMPVNYFTPTLAYQGMQNIGNQFLGMPFNAFGGMGGGLTPYGSGIGLRDYGMGGMMGQPFMPIMPYQPQYQDPLWGNTITGNQPVNSNFGFPGFPDNSNVFIGNPYNSPMSAYIRQGAVDYSFQLGYKSDYQSELQKIANPKAVDSPNISKEAVIFDVNGDGFIDVTGKDFSTKWSNKREVDITINDPNNKEPVRRRNPHGVVQERHKRRLACKR